MSDLLTFVREHIKPQLTSDGDRRKVRTAANHLRRLLEREPQPDDLESTALAGVLDLLAAERRRRWTILTVRDSLLKIARAALAAGLIDRLPTLPAIRRPANQQEQLLPWPPADLNLLLASARTMPGDVAGIPAKLWWPALLLTLLDTAASNRVLIDAPRTAYDRRAGTLAAGPYVYRLHPRVIEALDLIRRHDHAELFPWPFDRHDGALCTLYRRMKQLLYRAGLPHVTRNLFDRLRVTCEADPQVLDHVNLNIRFTPRPGAPRLPTSRERRRWDAITTPAETEPTWDSRPVLDARRRPRRWRPPTIYRLQPIDDSRTLARFFEESYLPLRLAGKPQRSANDYRRCVDRFGWYLACEPSFDHLRDDVVEHFLAWLRAKPLQPATVNTGFRGTLLALWRHAWRKKKVDDLPRDVPKFREPKRLAEAWSLDELGRILDAAAQEAGDVCGVPAGRWWVALILTLYDTGARIQAVLKAPPADFDPQVLQKTRPPTGPTRAPQQRKFRSTGFFILVSRPRQRADCNPGSASWRAVGARGNIEEQRHRMVSTRDAAPSHFVRGSEMVAHRDSNQPSPCRHPTRNAPASRNLHSPRTLCASPVSPFCFVTTRCHTIGARAWVENRSAKRR